MLIQNLNLEKDFILIWQNYWNYGSHQDSGNTQTVCLTLQYPGTQVSTHHQETHPDWEYCREGKEKARNQASQNYDGRNWFLRNQVGR